MTDNDGLWRIMTDFDGVRCGGGPIKRYLWEKVPRLTSWPDTWQHRDIRPNKLHTTEWYHFHRLHDHRPWTRSVTARCRCGRWCSHSTGTWTEGNFIEHEFIEYSQGFRKEIHFDRKPSDKVIRRDQNREWKVFDCLVQSYQTTIWICFLQMYQKTNESWNFTCPRKYELTTPHGSCIPSKSSLASSVFPSSMTS